MFIVGVLVGLVVGLFLWLPETILIADIMIGVFQLPGNMSPGANFLFSIALYAIWFLVIWAIFRRANMFSFFPGLLCSIPLPTILINAFLQSAGMH